MRMQKLVTGAAALIMACAGSAAMAQYGGPPPGPPPGNGYAQYFPEQPNQPRLGARIGWQAGFSQGRSDRMNGHSYRPTHTDEFKNVPDSPHGYPRDLFKQEYRDAFQKGYSHGFGR